MLLLVGCSLNLPIATEEIDRDLSGQFDGKWVLETNGPIGNCQNNFTRTYLTVEGGIGKTNRGGTGYISNTGNFRINDPVRDNSNWANRVYGGNLIKGEGRVIVDYQRFHATDCSIGVSIQRIS